MSVHHSVDLLTVHGVAYLTPPPENVARPTPRRFCPFHRRPLEARCRRWTQCCNDATAVAGYATVMMMMMIFNVAPNLAHNTDHFSGPGRADGRVRVCVCVRVSMSGQ